MTLLGYGLKLQAVLNYTNLSSNRFYSEVKFNKLKNCFRQRQDLAREYDELTERLDESCVATTAQVNNLKKTSKELFLVLSML
jgi:hypothetical protein